VDEPHSPDLVLDPANSDEAPLLANLLELYTHDLSGVFKLDVGAEGRFGYAKLPLYFNEPGRRFPLLFRVAGQLAGFALINRGSPVSDDPDVLDMAEFFVLRRYRRAGVGGRAAALLWDRHPASWVVRVSAGNAAGREFWTPTIANYSAGRYEETQRPGTPHGWHVFQFSSATAGEK
jgi:predicted acetyltransferase